jgi:hypothetical protein
MLKLLALHWELTIIAALTLACTLMFGGMMYYRSDAIAQESKTKEIRGAYLTLADKVKEQNTAILVLEEHTTKQKAALKEALVKLKAKEIKRVERVNTFERAMEAPRDTQQACAAAEGVATVRRILRGAPTP